MLILLDAMSWAQQDAAVWQNVRITELHGDGNALQACETIANRRPGRKLVVTAERDMRRDHCVLQRIKSLPDWLDNRTLVRRQK